MKRTKILLPACVACSLGVTVRKNNFANLFQWNTIGKSIRFLTYVFNIFSISWLKIHRNEMIQRKNRGNERVKLFTAPLPLYSSMSYDQVAEKMLPNHVKDAWA